MSRAKRSVRILFAVFLAAYAVLVTWPGITPFNRIEPLIFGLPFVFFWVALWIVLGFLVLLLTDRIESR